VLIGLDRRGARAGQTVGAGEVAEEVVEAAVLEIDDDDGVDLPEAFRQSLRRRRARP
jgi:hypothetical protein